ncbi:Asp-tRNA(Asn)/Glu-tRNA(Gln) amidotransferase A subunit family amidase [Neorhizobium galegae]|uniref:amidase n=1 Tax=Neorhizobium galegae TaxID=399 RepID=UPI00278B52A7|nr:amidase [Neorhizobium galegae]MDQ0134315.1 Asp-tRNA(Asn)/Glu-tRNA(Gln) amidotransferase A subunit family amidase [Neorhizobium galegae]
MTISSSKTASADIAAMSARAIAKAVASGTLSAEAVTEVWLDRIAAVEPSLHAFIHHAPEKTRALAAIAPKGPLAGVPFGIKDVIETRDMPTEYGSAAYPGWQPCRDAPVVHLARQAGAVIMGKTVSTEFATASPGATVNPFDPKRTPGGSSSGTAAALGAGLILLGLGTQTSGSTIRPAAYCGVAAMKPSPKLIETFGVKPLSQTLDIVGPMARDIRDLALLVSVCMRRSELAPDILTPESTLPLSKMGLFMPVHDPVADFAPLERAASVLGDVSAQAVPDWFEALGPAQDGVFGWEASVSLSTDRDLHWDKLRPDTHAFMERQAKSSFAGWQAGLAARDHALSNLDALFGDADFLVTPSAPGEAPLGLERTGPATYNIRWTLLGCPSVTIPAGFGPAGLPVGLQLVARPGQDPALLRQAAAVEDRLRAAGIEARPQKS